MQDNVYGQLSLTLPVGAAPGEPQIRMGSEVPACMQATYSSVILFMPVGWNGGIGAPAIRYLGVRKALVATNAVIDQGWTIWDGLSVCFWFVTSDSSSNNAAGTVVSSENIGNIYESGGSGGVIGNSFVTLGKPNDVGTTGVTTTITTFGNLNVNFARSVAGADFKIQDAGSSAGISTGRGVRMFAASQANSGAVGAALTDVLTMVNVADGTANWTPEPLRVYEAIIGGGYSTAAGQQPGWILAYGGGATQICGWDWQDTQVGANARNLTARTLFKSSATPAAMTNIRVRMISTAAAGANWLGNGNVSRYCEIRDIGVVTTNAYQNLPTV